MNSNYRILLVDDDRIIRHMTRVYMERLGYQVDLADNGEDAISKYSKHNYDLIIMDVRMPVMDGLEATRRIREIEESSSKDKVKIVAVTASEHKEVCLESGMNDYFHKTTLISHMKEMLSYVSTT